MLRSLLLFRRLGRPCVGRRFFCHVQSDEHRLVRTFQQDSIYFIELNRPLKRNCVTSDMAIMIMDAIDRFDNDDNVSVGIMYGKGGNFCAGFDMNEYRHPDSSRLRIGLAEKLASRKPIIAALDGYTLAAGLELALFCDMRVCEEDAVLGFLGRRFGIPLVDGGTFRLPKLIGPAKSLELVMTGKKINGRQAKEIGLIDDLCAVGCALGNAVSTAMCITKFSQDAVIADRKALLRATYQDIASEAIEKELKEGLEIIRKNGPTAASLFLDEGIGKHGASAIHTPEQIRLRDIPDVF